VFSQEIVVLDCDGIVTILSRKRNGTSRKKTLLTVVLIQHR
jgi:phage-related baseplate assembly protein